MKIDTTAFNLDFWIIFGSSANNIILEYFNTDTASLIKIRNNNGDR